MPQQTSPNDASILIEMIDRLKTDKGHVVTPSTSLFEDAGIDSLALIDLIEEIQIKFNIVFLSEDYSFERFATVDSIIDLISERKLTHHI